MAVGNNNVQISEATLARVAGIYSTNPFIGMCRKKIVSSFGRRELELREGDEILAVNGEYRDRMLSGEWLSTAFAAMDAIHMFGFVPLVKTEVAGPDGQPTPVARVPPVGTWRAFVNTDQYMRGGQLVAIELDSRFPKADVRVLSGFGHDPQPNGMLCTPIATVVRDMMWSSHMQTLALAAETRRTANRQLVEREMVLIDQARAMGVGMWGDSHPQHSDSAQIDPPSLDAVDAALDMWETFGAGRAASALQPGGAGSSAVSGLEIETQRMRPGEKHVSMTHPEGRHDLVNMLRLVQDEVCAAMGVPRSCLITDSTQGGNHTGINTTFLETLRYWERTLSRVLTEAFVWAEEEFVQSQRKRMLHQRFPRAPLIEHAALLRQIAEERRVTVQFSISAHTAPEEIRDALEAGVVTWDEGCTMYRAFLGLPAAKLPRPAPKEDSGTGTGGAARAAKPANPKPRRSERAKQKKRPKPESETESESSSSDSEARAKKRGKSSAV